MARRRLTAEQAADKWQRRMQTAAEDYTTGVNAVTESPTAAAAEQANKYQVGVQEAVAQGRFQRGLERVSLQDWKTAAVEKGAPRLATGATAAAPLVRTRLQQIFAAQDEVLAIVDQMPTDTLEQRIAKSTRWQMEMSRRRVK